MLNLLKGIVLKDLMDMSNKIVKNGLVIAVVFLF